MRILLGRGIVKTVTKSRYTLYYVKLSNDSWENFNPEELFKQLFGPGIRDRY